MKTFTSNKGSLLPVFVLLLGAGFFSSIGLAQESQTKTISKKVEIKNDQEVTKTKTIEVEEINGEKQVTVTTISNGEKTIIKYKGEEAEKFLEGQQKRMQEEVDKIHLEDLEDMEFTFNVEGMEEGDSKKIIIVKTDDTRSDQHENIVWTGDNGEEHHISINDMNLNVTDGEDGEPMKVQMSYTDENGKQVKKVMVIDKTEMADTMEDVEDILKDMNINIDLDIDVDEDDSKTVKTVIVKKHIIINEKDEVYMEDDDSEMFNSFSLSPNPSNGVINLEFEASNKGAMDIILSTLEGNEIFKDTFNGKGKYSKTIHLNKHQGVVMLTITQGNEVEVRKLIIE
ncbi:MAG: T9SS type A sorting domain-containing protein [Salibacteraceae bacterium]